MLSNDALIFMQGLVQESLPEADRPELWRQIRQQLGGLDEQIVADAVERALSRPDVTANMLFPIIADEVNQVQAKLVRTRGGTRKDMDIIRQAMAHVQDRTYATSISDEIRRFAKSLWPDIDDNLIRDNYCDISYYFYSRGCLDEKTRARLVLKKTGLIEMHALQ